MGGETVEAEALNVDRIYWHWKAANNQKRADSGEGYHARATTTRRIAGPTPWPCAASLGSPWRSTTCWTRTRRRREQRTDLGRAPRHWQGQGRRRLPAGPRPRRGAPRWLPGRDREV